jgi:hypothetical protein
MDRRERVERADWEQIKDLLDDELDALPEKYRTAIILFHLEDRSVAETAALLGANVSTVKTRLSRGRELLKGRLARRGIGISVVALGGLLTEKTSLAAVPATFMATSVKAATLFAAGEAAAGGLVSAQAAALTQGALKMLYVAKLKVAAAVVAAATVVTGGGVAVVQQVAQGEPKVARQANSTPEQQPVDAVSARRMAKLKDNLDTFRFDLAYAVRRGDKEMQHVYLHAQGESAVFRYLGR